MGKDLKDKAIDIKGKKYVLVSDRIIYFNENYPGGYINTKLVSDPESDQIIIKATVYPEPGRSFTGYSQAIKGDSFINKTAALENAETSAVGRALAMMGIGVLDSIASVDEINKAQGSTGQRSKLASEKQVEWMRNEAARVSGEEEQDNIDNWIESVLTLKPEHVPSFKVKDAVDKIREQKPRAGELPVISLSEEQVDKAIAEIRNETLPY